MGAWLTVPLGLGLTLASPPSLRTGAPLETAPVPASTPDALPTRAARATTLYVNFDGAVLRDDCGNDARYNCSTLGYLFENYVGPFTAGASYRAAILDAVRSDLAELGVAVTGVRPPPEIDYTMVLYGDLGEQGFAGVAPYIDCADQKSYDTSFARGYTSPNTGSTVILQEAAHTWGLEHVNRREDLLHPIAEGFAPSFLDECSKIVSNTDFDESPGVCNRMHTLFCDAGWQNGFRELRHLFGPAQPDVDRPIVELLSPVLDARYEYPSVVEIRTHIEDARHPQWYEVSFELDGELIFSDALWGDFELAFVVPGPGRYELTMRVADEAGNASELPVRFDVLEAGALDASLPSGCSLRGADTPSPETWLGSVGLLLLFRRRRRRPGARRS